MILAFEMRDLVRGAVLSRWMASRFRAMSKSYDCRLEVYR